MSVDQLLFIVAFILFLLAAFGVNLGRVSPGWLGAAVAILAFIL
jgi:hypothetical protein